MQNVPTTEKRQYDTDFLLFLIKQFKVILKEFPTSGFPENSSFLMDPLFIRYLV